MQPLRKCFGRTSTLVTLDMLRNHSKAVVRNNCGRANIALCDQAASRSKRYS
jgi:hypothetical protein